MLNRVKIQNFKSIGEPGVDLELKPLTFLVGPNGGGKSSILEGMAVASQGAPSGKLTSFPSWKEILHFPNESRATLEVYYNRPVPVLYEGHRLSFTKDSYGQVDIQIEVASEILQRMKGLIQLDKTSLNAFQRNTFLLASTRGIVPYNDDAEYPEWVGVQGEYLLPLLARIFGGGLNEQQIASYISKWANRFSVDGLNAGIRERNTIGSDYLDPELKTALNLALSSSGSKQILNVITQLFWSPKGSLLMIEEPEISLHPKAQIDVLEMFAEAINEEDKQIIATTHGLFLIQAIGYAVQKGWLKANQVAVHHIEKKKNVGTISKQLPMDEKGYIKGWIPSFASVERKLLEEAIKNIPEE